jgi:hypothetical protein
LDVDRDLILTPQRPQKRPEQLAQTLPYARTYFTLTDAVCRILYRVNYIFDGFQGQVRHFRRNNDLERFLRLPSASLPCLFSLGDKGRIMKPTPSIRLCGCPAR